MATKKIKLDRDKAYDLWASKLVEAGIDPEHETMLFDTFAENAETGDYDLDTLLSFIDADIEAIQDNS